MKPHPGEKMPAQTDDISEGDIVVAPGEKIGIVVGIYGAGYCEVMINRGAQSTRIVPYRSLDLRKIGHEMSVISNQDM